MNRKNLLEALDALNWAVSSKPIVEEMGCYRIAGKTLRATDGALLVQVELAETTGLDCTVPAAGLKALLKDLPNDDIILKIDDKSAAAKLTVATDRVKGRFALASGPGVLDGLPFDVAAWRPATDGLKEAVRRCRFAASGDASSGVYTGVLVKGDCALATDRVRIARFRAKAELSPEAVVLPAELAAVLDRRAADISEWAVEGGTAYLRGKGVTWGARLPQGAYTEKAAWYVGESDKLGQTLELPEGIMGMLKRHLDQQSEVLDLDREVELAVDGKVLTVRSTDGVRYELEETVGLVADAGAFKFAAHPQCLLDTLGTTRVMRYDTSTVKNEKEEACPVFPFVAFVQTGDLGTFTYLATVEIK